MATERRPSGWWVVLVTAGAIGLGFGARYALRVQAFVDASTQGVGEVLRHDRVSRPGARAGTYTFYPVLRYEHPDGRRIEARANLGAKPAPYTVGETVAVRFDRHHPGDLRIDSPLGLWAVPMLFGGAGALCLLFGVALRIR